MSGIKGVVYDKGVNDMPRGWTKANEWNKRVYRVWHSMFVRCYSEKYHEIQPTYIGCNVCERWLTLSNFVTDITKIPNYELWLSGFSVKKNPYQLDKDIKSGGTNKCYCLEQCQFVNYAENTRQANKTRDYDNIRGKNNYMYGRTGEKNPIYGKPHTEEHKKKISESLKGKYKGEKNHMYGKHHSEETRQKQSEARKGKYKGENSPCAKKVIMIEPNTKQPVFTWQYVRQATEFYGISEMTLNYYLKGKSKSGHLYNGFLWYYEEDYKQMKESH